MYAISGGGTRRKSRWSFFDQPKTLKIDLHLRTNKRSMEVVVGLGSDLGDRMAELRLALDALSRRAKRMSWSRVYSGPARGFEQPTDFLNAAVWLETDCDPFDLLRFCLDHELERGRQRSLPTYQSRPIDLDLVYFGNLVVQEPHLTLPHPHRLKRRFVLQPAVEVAPDFLDPLENKRLSELLQECPDREPLHIFPQAL